MPALDLELWSAPWNALSQDLQALVPRLFSSLALLVLGLLLTALLRSLVHRMLAMSGSDNRLSHLFLFRVWSRSHPGQTPSQGLANAFGYGCLFLFAMASARVLGGAFGDELLGGLLKAAPRLFTVLLILMLALLLASAASLVTQWFLASSGSRHSAFWGKTVAWSVFTAAALLALEPLGLAGQLLSHAFLILLAGAALAGGIAFGLGCKDLARETVMELLNPDKASD